MIKISGSGEKRYEIEVHGTVKQLTDELAAVACQISCGLSDLGVPIEDIDEFLLRMADLAVDCVKDKVNPEGDVGK